MAINTNYTGIPIYLHPEDCDTEKKPPSKSEEVGMTDDEIVWDTVKYLERLKRLEDPQKGTSN